MKLIKYLLIVLCLFVLVGCNRKYTFREITSDKSHSFELGELLIDYDDDEDVYDCWLEEEQRHVFIDGSNVQYRFADDTDVVLYQFNDDKYVLFFYVELDLDEEIK